MKMEDISNRRLCDSALASIKKIMEEKGLTKEEKLNGILAAALHAVEELDTRRALR